VTKVSKRILRRPAVLEKVGESTSTIYDKMSRGEFPRPVKLGARAVGWIEEEVDHYIDQRIAARDAKAAA
jgi:prophage regulatory protein